MRIYSLSICKDYETEQLITTNRISVFDKIMDSYSNKVGVYLDIWENEEIIGSHDIDFLNRMYDLPFDVLINNIIDNKIDCKFSSNC